ncbi:MAG: glucose dehydrogenase [Actinobacteria bacterium]|nr:glucose dehydrogenase [Actinomycetota bacterium]
MRVTIVQRPAAVLLVLALSLSGCTRSSEPEDRAPRPSPSAPRPSPTSEPFPEVEPDPLGARIKLQPVASGFESPLLVTNAGDGSGRLFVVEQTGRIKTVSRKGRVSAEVFLDVSDRIVAGGEQGLLGLAFEPDYADNGRFYVNYTDVSGDTIVARYQVSNDPKRADPGSAEVILTVDQPYSNHNGGHLAFGPDGYLYVGLGDGGSGGDPHGNGQNPDTLLASILRLDVSGSSGYDIPGDNPFAGGGGNGGGAPEVWAYGLRNPWRFAFDRVTGHLWIGDVGQEEFEEIDRAPAGASGLNFGWNVTEGNACYGSSSCDTGGLEPPVTQYTHADGCSVTGGHVYRGERYPVLTGGYLFADYCSGLLWVIEAKGHRGDPKLALETGRSVSSFGESEDGELFLVDISAGELLQVTAR